jgi:hypothetical protein
MPRYYYRILGHFAFSKPKFQIPNLTATALHISYAFLGVKTLIVHFKTITFRPFSVNTEISYILVIAQFVAGKKAIRLKTKLA